MEDGHKNAEMQLALSLNKRFVIVCPFLACLRQTKSSNQGTDSSKGTSSRTNHTEACETLVDCHDGLFVEVAVVLNLAVDHVGEEALHCEVALVLPHSVGGLAHPEVRPAGISDPVQVLVVLNRLKALLKNLGVEQGVESVLGDRKSIDLAWENARVLLTRQVLYS